MNNQTINYRNNYNGNDYYKTSLKKFVKKISCQSNNDYDYSQDLKQQILKSTTNYYEFTGDGNEISNIYFDIDVDNDIDDKLYKKIMKNEKYKEIETEIKTFIVDKLNEMKMESLKEMKFVDCRNHRITYGGKNKFSYRIFCYTHKLEKYKIKNLVKYLNTIIQRHKFISNVELFKTEIINLNENVKIYKNKNDLNKSNDNTDFDVFGNSSRYKFDLTIHEVKDILNKLSDKWFKEYTPWLNVLTVIKNLYNTGIYNNEEFNNNE